MKAHISTELDKLYDEINSKGFAHVKSILNATECDSLKELYGQEDRFRKTINMKRYRFGQGEYKYLQYPLPKLIEELRTEIYSLLAPLANRWASALKLPISYPESHDSFLKMCAESGQTLPTPLILKYQAGGHNTLHQDLYGDVYFPMQAIFCLSQPNQDFEGGSLVLTEQVPRAQSKASVINPGLGDMVIIPTKFRPVAGSRGYYRVNMRHGVSEVLSGMRHTLGIILHDAK